MNFDQHYGILFQGTFSIPVICPPPPPSGYKSPVCKPFKNSLCRSINPGLISGSLRYCTKPSQGQYEEFRVPFYNTDSKLIGR